MGKEYIGIGKKNGIHRIGEHRVPRDELVNGVPRDWVRTKLLRMCSEYLSLRGSIRRSRGSSVGTLPAAYVTE